VTSGGHRASDDDTMGSVAPLAENARALGNFLAKLRRRGITKVVLVAYSMGGLVTLGAVSERHSPEIPEANAVITLGTPYSGSTEAGWCKMLPISCPAGAATPAIRDLSDPNALEVFEHVHRGQGVQFYLVGGNGAGTGDLVVSLNSSLDRQLGPLDVKPIRKVVFALHIKIPGSPIPDYGHASAVQRYVLQIVRARLGNSVAIPGGMRPRVPLQSCSVPLQGGGPYYLKANVPCSDAMTIALSPCLPDAHGTCHAGSWTCRTTRTGIESYYTECSRGDRRVTWVNGA